MVESMVGVSKTQNDPGEPCSAHSQGVFPLKDGACRKDKSHAESGPNDQTEKNLGNKVMIEL